MNCTVPEARTNQDETLLTDVYSTTSPRLSISAISSHSLRTDMSPLQTELVSEVGRFDSTVEEPISFEEIRKCDKDFTELFTSEELWVDCYSIHL